jgi:hypothetical protein
LYDSDSLNRATAIHAKFETGKQSIACSLTSKTIEQKRQLNSRLSCYLSPTALRAELSVNYKLKNMNYRVFAGQYRVEGGRRILQCHSRGDKRYSPFFCFVKAFGTVDSIENHYQCAKRFEGCPPARNWAAVRYCQRRGLEQVAWQIGSYRLPVKSNERGTSFAIDDWGIQYYIALWHRHLSERPEKVEFARQFDDFEDPFERDFPFCQADIIRVATREGVAALLPYFASLKQLLDAPYSEQKQPIEGWLARLELLHSIESDYYHACGRW